MLEESKDLYIKKDYDFGSLHGYKTRGLVSYYIETSSKKILSAILKHMDSVKLDYIPVGDGSNILIRDSFAGAFINYTSKNISHSFDADDVYLSVDSGLSKDELTNYCIEHGISGLEFWAGIPGLVGGGIAMNAGAYGMDLSTIVSSINVLTKDGESVLESTKLKWSYRNLSLNKSSVITSAKLKLKRSDSKTVSSLVKEKISDRKAKHPLDYPSCGSVFKNPPGDKGAWLLIKEAGLCDYKLGGAAVSSKHSNFIVNLGTASSKDIIDLIELIKKKVKDQHLVELEEEIRVV